MIPMGHPTDIVYADAERPPCEVRLDPGGADWSPARVRAWYRRSDGWAAHVVWTSPDGAPGQGVLPSGRVRLS